MKSTKKYKNRSKKNRTLPATMPPRKVTPGMMHKLDGRTSAKRMMVASYKEICDDLGGEDELSLIQRTTIQRYVFMTALISSWELAYMEDPEDNKDLLGRITQMNNAASGLATKLGIGKKQQTAQSIRSYAAEK